ncbi:transposase [Paraburkholderia sp. BL10I2N1]|uniref:transposase n=1 Tax=Paraburkholderia sp. BL10I2N1 TaxID=1938796 RepID=UPI0010608071|nr:transposase [Paraburkholderia sp. BL10I2N1]TDN61984.1 transposase [Paraburkholderia sp. BL10I2N1]
MDTVTESTELKGARKCRRRTPDENREIVEETLSSGRSVVEIARSHAVNANQVFDWRKQYLEGRLDVDAHGCALLPATVNGGVSLHSSWKIKTILRIPYRLVAVQPRCLTD